jgi:hypothetical protein
MGSTTSTEKQVLDKSEVSEWLGCTHLAHQLHQSPGKSVIPRGLSRTCTDPSQRRRCSVLTRPAANEFDDEDSTTAETASATADDSCSLTIYNEFGKAMILPLPALYSVQHLEPESCSSDASVCAVDFMYEQL